MTIRTLQSRRAYCLTALADPACQGERRQILERKLATIEAQLPAHQCRRCGLPLTAPDSIALGVGPECYQHEISAA